MAAAGTDTQPARALADMVGRGATVCLLGLQEYGDDRWTVLEAAGVELVRVSDVTGAVRALSDPAAQVVIAAADRGPALTAAVRGRRELASTHVVLCAGLDSPDELRAALDAGADDVMRVPFEPEVLAARVAAGLRAARLRENEALLRSLVANLPGAVYRCACDEHWTMQWLSDEIEQIAGFPASDFIDSAVRTFASVIHPDDREQVERSVMEAVEARRPFTLEYRVQRRDGGVRWVLERGQAQEAGDGRRWLDGAIFDITARRAAELALHEREIVEVELAEVHASRARILDAADRARREIERNLHDGAQQRFVSLALRLQIWAAGQRELSDDSRGELDGVLTDMRLADREVGGSLDGDREAFRRQHNAKLDRHGRAMREAGQGVCEPAVAQDRGMKAAGEIAQPNVAKYAGATHAWVDVERRNDHLDVEVGDDGVGGADVRAGSGLQGLRDRVAAVNGTLDVHSPRAAGTVLRARLPV